MDVQKFKQLLQAKENGCIEWIGGWVTDGYGRLRFNGVTILAHRLAFRLHHGHDAVSLVLHTCNNRLCCNPEHLYDGTHQDNMNDAKAAGSFNKPGSKNPFSKLTELDVKLIRWYKLAFPNLTNGRIGQMFGVNNQTISGVCLRKTWRHI